MVEAVQCSWILQPKPAFWWADLAEGLCDTASLGILPCRRLYPAQFPLWSHSKPAVKALNLPTVPSGSNWKGVRALGYFKKSISLFFSFQVMNLIVQTVLVTLQKALVTEPVIGVAEYTYIGFLCIYASIRVCVCVWHVAKALRVRSLLFLSNTKNYLHNWTWKIWPRPWNPELQEWTPKQTFHSENNQPLE